MFTSPRHDAVTKQLHSLAKMRHLELLTMMGPWLPLRSFSLPQIKGNFKASSDQAGKRWINYMFPIFRFQEISVPKLTPTWKDSLLKEIFVVLVTLFCPMASRT